MPPLSVTIPTPTATPYGPQFVLTTADNIYQTSDSIAAPDGDSQEVALTINRLFGLADQNPNGPRPQHYNRGISGTKIAQQLLAFQSDWAAYGPFTKIIAIQGIFDVIGGGATVGTVNDTTTATYLGAFNLWCQLINILQVPMYVIGPHFIGEKYPSGNNPTNDANLDLMDAGMQVICQRYPTLITYRSNRQSLYTLEQYINLPLPGVSGNLMVGTDGQLTHFYPAGRALADRYHQADIKLVAATSPIAQRAIYTAVTPPNPSSISNWWDPRDLLATVANGGNVTTWPNKTTARAGTSADLITTPATKPTFATNAFGTLPAVQSAGAGWIKSGAFGVPTRTPPFMTAFIFKATNATGATQLWLDGLVDGGVGVQEPYVATLVTSGKVSSNDGGALTVDTDVGISSAQFHSVIICWSGNLLQNGNSFIVIDGRMTPLGSNGNVARTGRVLFANVGAASICTGSFASPGVVEWDSAYGPLPDWRDVYGWHQAICSSAGLNGTFPQ